MREISGPFSRTRFLQISGFWAPNVLPPICRGLEKSIFLVLSFYPTLRKACEIPNRRGAIFRFRGKSNKNIKKNIQFIERKYVIFIFFSKNTKIPWKSLISTKDTAMRPKSCDFWLICSKVFSFLIIFCHLYRTHDNYWCKNLMIHLFSRENITFLGRCVLYHSGSKPRKSRQKQQISSKHVFWTLFGCFLHWGKLPSITSGPNELYHLGI